MGGKDDLFFDSGSNVPLVQDELLEAYVNEISSRYDASWMIAGFDLVL